MTAHRRLSSPLTGAALIAFAAIGSLGWARDCLGGPAATILPVTSLLDGKTPSAPVDNSAFAPASDAKPAPALTAVLEVVGADMQTEPLLVRPAPDGRDARLFPAIRLEVFSLGDLLLPVERGEMLRERQARGGRASYWRVIPQIGRIWREPGEGEWSRAALPLMLVNDTENHAHQGLATFLYRNGKVSELRFQFVQQTAPYLLQQHFVMWGMSALTVRPGDTARLAERSAVARAELADRLPARPWSELVKQAPAGALAGFGGPLKPKWMVEAALVRDGTLYYQDAPTAYGPYPYPLEMRFGVRSIMKSVAAPLSLLHLAELYGPYVLNLHIGDYVSGLDPKFAHIRFIDAANMATGFGGVGSLKTHPNDGFDGYLEGDYDAWYLAPSNAEKLRLINTHLRPYPWEPGTVFRYRDQDFYLLGLAVDAFVKSVRGPDADVWQMLQEEVFAPIGIHHAPAVRTREPGGRDGSAWFSAGYYPSLDDLAKIALLFQHLGAHDGKQLLHRELTADLMAAREALDVAGDASVDHTPANARPGRELYEMGWHFISYVGSRSHTHFYLPTMSGSGENEVILFPNDMISIRTASAAGLPPGESAMDRTLPTTPQVVDRLAPF
jgi:CubicO group peptidase (beta-lactamase class C family)